MFIAFISYHCDRSGTYRKMYIGIFAVVFFNVLRCCLCTLGDLSKATVLVTGAAGFIGSHLVMNLVKQGCRSVVAVDNFDAYYSIYLKRLRADLLANTTGIKITEGDVCDIDFMKNLFTQNAFTHVVHLAAQPGVRYSFVRPLSYIRNNIECFTVLMEGIRLNHDKPYPRVLYASSSSVYGLNKKIPFSEEDPVLHPSNLYGATKRADELLAHSYHHLYGITTVGFRFFTVYGPRGRPDMAAALFTEGIMSGKPITLFNKGELLRDYTYVDDIADGLAAAVARVEDDGFLVYNLGNKHPVSTNKFLSLLEGYLGEKAEVRYEDSKADMAVTFANTSLAAANLGFEAKTSIEEGLRRYVHWFKSHEMSLMPCVAECSHANMCYKSAWDKAAATSARLTDKCSSVLYTMLLAATRNTELTSAPADNVGCNIAFVSETSAFFRGINGRNENEPIQYRNWVVVPVGEDIGSRSYFSRVPKMSPTKFFGTAVQYVVYASASTEVNIPMNVLIKRMAHNSSGETAIFAANQIAENGMQDIYDEFKSVNKFSRNRLNPSFFTSPKRLYEHKMACKSYEYKYPGLTFDTVLGSSLLLHDLTSDVAKQFRCRWFRDHQEWADRDHLSGTVTLAMMNYEYKKEEGSDHGPWLAIGQSGGDPVYAHIIPPEENPLQPVAPGRKKKGEGGWFSSYRKTFRASNV